MKDYIYSAVIEADGVDVAHCGDCEWVGTLAEAAEIGDAHLTPGDSSPSCRCPECGSLAYPPPEPPALPTIDLDLVQRRLVGIGYAFHEGDDDDDPDNLGKHWYVWTCPGNPHDVRTGPVCDSVEECVISALDSLISFAIDVTYYGEK